MIGGLTGGSRAEFEFWRRMNADFMMLGVPYDFFFDDKKVNRVIELRNEFEMNLLIHPRPDGEMLLSPANPAAHNVIFESMKIIKKLVRDEKFIKKVIMHLSTYRIPEKNYKNINENDAIVNSAPFYEKLRNFKGLDFVFENVYPPGIGWEELGYIPEHFRLFDLGKDCEFCFDTGHFNLSCWDINELINMPFRLTCMHLHSNNGRDDEHMPLMRRNFKKWKIVERLISHDKYMVIEAKNRKDMIEYTIPYLRKNLIAP